ncbi:MAG: cytochrome-c oxidase, cbb3-type subunit II, partial [Planctomycetes bacterium]|nr:cytochrome-c oxidase, cbb3-type subunit II [Planctomycetota bacterium]
AAVALAALVFICVLAWLRYQAAQREEFRWHDYIERRPLAFSVLVGLAIIAGGVVELLPGLLMTREVPMTDAGTVAVKPYTPLELEGRDVYVSEGCYVCHSQMIRPFRSEQIRYGAPSRIEESMWDHPFQWGSKRTGPDIARVGGKYPDSWHYKHMIDPRSMSEGSIMPKYPWLLTDKIDPAKTKHKLKIMRALGVPYEKEEFELAEQKYREQAGVIVKELTDYGVDVDEDSKLVALIGYLLRLGKNEKPSTTIAAPAATNGERKAD